jgi:hypothetical protein
MVPANTSMQQAIVAEHAQLMQMVMAFAMLLLLMVTEMHNPWTCVPINSHVITLFRVSTKNAITSTAPDAL